MADETKVSAKLQKIIDSVAELSVLELSELVKALEEKFDVKAAAAVPVASTGTGSSAAGGEAAPAVEEKTEFDVVITNAGANKIAVIKVVREFKPDLGLKEAKDMVDAPPASLGTMKKEQAEEAKTKLTAAGAQVELK
ncbi:50S ribosomal protein L7/L12 [Candidatus Shapirobacteria bacterium RIFOXYD1_FULL_38_32]|uniref:Large ribosomal subunit protein bL12 n=2 Tax=Candidatus Shapironibacteriota TaxID=1752721 RepID=A0A1F7SQ83_9BACT|nr:MAG: 50S ribosomal protein L7/L12 [Candidatus Shapirobacteria bacterium GW2011_GWE1_38_92]OGL55926.1 MAG: 50S ribosomal protein L7/L12 [Candidatus Shapirobacteria bacterium RIFOXYB1_FULL_38_38]OGL56686.1 MAG: 50S ribosomal protein L7/L12 [Candidatus Shapirobacteria bacterium RIFOXYC1_FULL_38_24]OGL57980.1 MAG: 50S ribosomal protein L7/L12 [Candidatus Shapirobacteria bacterium RIFOXYD1_FULL_38_32]HAP37561.1 50S ribosomal protein L7/L12 [Candidatus Shapirobacteria bacterium]